MWSHQTHFVRRCCLSPVSSIRSEIRCACGRVSIFMSRDEKGSVSKKAIARHGRGVASRRLSCGRAVRGAALRTARCEALASDRGAHRGCAPQRTTRRWCDSRSCHPALSLSRLSLSLARSLHPITAAYDPSAQDRVSPRRRHASSQSQHCPSAQILNMPCPHPHMCRDSIGSHAARQPLTHPIQANGHASAPATHALSIRQRSNAPVRAQEACSLTYRHALWRPFASAGPASRTGRFGCSLPS